MLENINLQKYIDMAMEYSPKLLMAIAVLFLGLWVINRIIDVLSKMLKRSGLDEDITPFIQTMVGVLLKMLLIFSVAELVGVKTTSFVAILAAAGFAVGMALQGSLANFAAGVMILAFKPYRTGDLIQTNDQLGTVDEIQVFNTILTSLDHKKIIIPNSMAISGIVENLSEKKMLRVDLEYPVPYAENFPKIRSIILKALDANPKILKDPAPFVGILNYDSHSITLAVRPYATTEDYWDVYFDSYADIKSALSAAGVKVAYSEGVELGEIGG